MSAPFTRRHIGSGETEIKEMLQTVNAKSTEDLANSIVPEHIRLARKLNLPEAMSENEYLEHITSVANKNKLFKSYIGLGYYGTITPPVILRNIFENPGWYTAYTPYQAEIAQGRLEALLKTNSEDKVEKVLEIFKACGVDAWAEDLKAKYLKEAFEHLEAIAVVSNRKQPLIELANYLMNRNQ